MAKGAKKNDRKRAGNTRFWFELCVGLMQDVITWIHAKHQSTIANQYAQSTFPLMNRVLLTCTSVVLLESLAPIGIACRSAILCSLPHAPTRAFRLVPTAARCNRCPPPSGVETNNEPRSTSRSQLPTGPPLHRAGPGDKETLIWSRILRDFLIGPRAPDSEPSQSCITRVTTWERRPAESCMSDSRPRCRVRGFVSPWSETGSGRHLLFGRRGGCRCGRHSPQQRTPARQNQRHKAAERGVIADRGRYI